MEETDAAEDYFPDVSGTSDISNESPLVITEVMIRNKATLMDGYGLFHDWFEIYNRSDEPVSLKEWAVSDKNEHGGFSLPDKILNPGDYFILYAVGEKNYENLDSSIPSVCSDDSCYVNFELTADEELSLFSPEGNLADSIVCCDTENDVSYASDSEGKFYECIYPTPGAENTIASYCLLCEKENTPSDLIINEVMTFNRKYIENDALGYCDWVELKNASDSVIELSDYFLSSTSSDYLLFNLPAGQLKPGETFILLCLSEEDRTGKNVAANKMPLADFSLDSTNDHLYLSKKNVLVDYVTLKNIPAGYSYGRYIGENGFFYISEPTPGTDNSSGARYISEMPSSDVASGVYEGIENITVSLSASGTIYYTTDGSMPSTESQCYSGPITLSDTTVLRAVSKEEGAAVSSALTLNFIINEGHSLPVLCVSSDDTEYFNWMYGRGKKEIEIPGNLEFIDGEQGFKLDCGITMTGGYSLINLKRHNMSFKFRAVYGTEELNYPLYGDENEIFHALTVRGGQDVVPEGIRTELFQNLCLDFTDNVYSQRSRYCVLYVNGEYYGLFALKEKVNRANIAENTGVDKSSVEIVDGPVDAKSDFFKEVVSPCIKLDMKDNENYSYISSVLDIDSYIDWAIMEGYSANYDIETGNVAYYRSEGTEGKWKMIYYDLDSAWRLSSYTFSNVLNLQVQNENMLMSLMANSEFREKFISRAAEALKTTLSDENVQLMIDMLVSQVIDEKERDTARWNGDTVYLNRQAPVQTYLDDNDHYNRCISAIDRYLQLTEDELALFK